MPSRSSSAGSARRTAPSSRATPLPDFGGGHPDPNLTYAADLVHELHGPEAPDFGAASDGDGDRNMILGPGTFVSPSDSLAVLLANAQLVPGYAGRVRRRRALDADQRSRGPGGASVSVFRASRRRRAGSSSATCSTPAASRLCGEESFGTGSDHVREKDGLWAVLFWVDILAARTRPVEAILHEHWREFGRNYYTRHDYEEVPAEAAALLIEGLRKQLADLPGRSLGPYRIRAADEFAYLDPVDGSRSAAQGLRVLLDDDARIVFRLSGTGTSGATVRVYIEALETDLLRQRKDAQELLAPLIAAADELAGIRRLLKLERPTVIT